MTIPLGAFQPRRATRRMVSAGLVALFVAQAWAPMEAGATPAPTAVIIVTPGGDANVGQTLLFDGSSSTNAVDWVWDFGDGAQAVGQSTTHAYHQGGAYVVQLLVHGPDQQWAKVWKEVRVQPYYAGKTVETFQIPTQGFLLAGTVTRPTGAGPCPTILEYGPYVNGVITESSWSRTLVRSGYNFVRVTMPGRKESQGVFDLFGPSTAQAGYDTVEWIAAQDWSDGQVALTGFSAPAIAALATATLQPPHLVTVAAKGAYADLYRDDVHQGGTVNADLFVNTWNAAFLAEPATNPTPGELTAFPGNAAGTATSAVDLNARLLYDDYWAARTMTDKPLGVPVLYYGTHADLWPRAAPELLRWVAPAGGRVSLIYGGHGPIDPTGFNVALQTEAGGPGESAVGETRAWFDHFLKGADNGVEGRAPLSLLVPRGADWNAALGYRWLGLSDWPDPSTNWVRLHLDGPAGPGNPGRLSRGPATHPGPDAALGGPAWGATGLTVVDDAQQLLYQTDPLGADVTVAGPATLRLFGSLAGPDAAWNVQILEALPDGSSRIVQEGTLQASHRALDAAKTRYNVGGDIIQPWHPHDALRPVTPGAVVEYHLEIPAMFNTFMAGSRLRIAIETNDARATLVSQPTIPTALRFEVHHDEEHPSALLLPVLPDPDALRLAVPYGEPSP